MQNVFPYIKDFRSVGAGSCDSNHRFTETGEEIALSNCKEFISSLCSLLSYQKELLLIERLYENTQKNETTELISSTFNYYGSDKSINHSYELVYSTVLTNLGINNNLNILEIGLGTNNSNIVSNMGAAGKPGASLRAFKTLCPNAQIYGADIDESILFTESRINTCKINQLEFESFNNILSNFGNIKYDLIIDDGLHSVTSNLNTLNFAIQNIKKDGYIIIEDIYNPHNLWNTLATVMQDILRIRLYQCQENRGMIAVIQLIGE